MTAARSIWHLSATDPDRRELVVELPIEVVSEANLREHWRTKAVRVKQQKNVAALVLRPVLSLHGHPGFPCTVTMVRLIGPKGRRLDDDNNVGGFKAIRDAIAKCLGVDDRDPRVTWRCEQRAEKPRRWGVEIRIVEG